MTIFLPVMGRKTTIHHNSSKVIIIFDIKINRLVRLAKSGERVSKGFLFAAKVPIVKL
jgi:hypothetical protein